jgi:DNA helicase-2/ATP-dependent DNA helicase PcrA
VEEFKKAYKGLNKEQLIAVDHIDGPVLVIAGPGTGKTHLLTTRIANILNKTDALPQNILCLTFTESAAHTMRERLTTILGKSAYDVSISTYHAFGNELIRRYHEYFSESADQQAIEQLGIDTLLRSIIDKLPYSNPLKGDYFIRDVKSLISDAKRALLSPNDFRDLAAENQKFYSQLRPILKTVLSDFKRVDKKSITSFAELLQKTTRLPTTSEHREYIPILRFWLDELARALESFADTGKTSLVTAWKNKWLTKNEDGEFIVIGENQTAKLTAFADIYQEYELGLKNIKAFDYDDMINRAITGLEASAELRYTLQETYQYILLDEFQDTNAAQLRLIELLTSNEASEGRPNVMAVGDDDQAIYAFQGADYSHMLAFTRLYKDVEIITLTDNYRSTASVLNVASAVAEQITERLQNNLPAVAKKLIPQVPPKTTSVVGRYEFKSDVAQYAWVAKEISRLIKSGVSPADIAVLAPQHKYLEPLVPYLHHGGISVRYEKRENVLDDPIVLSLIVMAKLVLSLSANDYPAADSLWPEVLSSESWQLPTQLLWELSWKANDEKSHWTNILMENELTKDIALYFVKLSSMVKRETLETILDYLIGITPLNLSSSEDETYRSPIYNFYFSEAAIGDETGDFWQLLSNMTVLRQHLREYRIDPTGPLQLSDFIEFVNAHRQANINIINTSPYYESVDAVQLMTAYRSKGQEFDSVFILGTLDEVWGSAAHRQTSLLSLPPNLEYIRYAGMTTDEQLRLFFVAITRTKRNLYLTSYQSTYTNKPLTRLKFLGEVVNEDGSVSSPLMPEGNQLIHQSDTSAPELATLSLYWHTRHQEAASKADLQALLMPRLQYFQLSPTHINQYVDVLRDGPRTFFMNTLLRFPHSTQASAQYGNAIHETLDWLHSYKKEVGKLPTEEAVIDSFNQRLESKRLVNDQEKLLKQRGKDALHSYLAQRSNTILPDNKTEFNFRREGVFVDKAHLTGNIDKLIIDNQNKKITIVDYKTGRSHSNWSNDLVLHKYRQQLYTYKLLVERSHTFKGYSVEGGYLEFVEPDANGRINTLRLDFDDNEQAALEKLIGGVWRRIMKLEFPDIAGQYASSLKGIRDFEDDIRKEA